MHRKLMLVYFLESLLKSDDASHLILCFCIGPKTRIHGILTCFFSIICKTARFLFACLFVCFGQLPRRLSDNPF